MTPDFTKAVTDILAKRAAFLCSNPECRVPTVGPNSELSKATTIGEAAHIYGARPDAPRYDPQMSDLARAEITNGIWLCRNCHGKIDRDAFKYPAALLFAWREEHERYAADSLGVAERLRFDQQEAALPEFQDYPPVIRRIVLDKPPGWEWRPTSELMRHLNRPVFRELQDLRNGLYTRPPERVTGDPMQWVSARLNEMQSLISPIEKLLERLTASWGPSGQPGDASEIHHVCLLIRDAARRSVEHEQRLWFVDIDDNYRPMVELLKDNIGSQVEKFDSIPAMLDETVDLAERDHSGTAEEPLTIRKVLTVELPENWVQDMQREMRRVGHPVQKETSSQAFWSGLGFVALVFFVIYWIF